MTAARGQSVAVGDGATPGSRLWTAVLVVMALAWAGVGSVITMAPLSLFQVEHMVGPLLLVQSLLGSLLAWRAARASRDDVGRRAWRYVMLSLALSAVSCPLFALFPTFPSVGDVFRLAMVPVLLTGLLRFREQREDSAARSKVSLDVVIVAAGAFMGIWYWSLGGILVSHQSGALEFAVAVCYPISDLVLVFGGVVAWVGVRDGGYRRPALAILLAMLFIVVTDVQRSHRLLVLGEAGYMMSRSEWLCLLTGYALLAAAGALALRGGTGSRGICRRELPGFPALPLLALSLGYLLLFVLAMRDGMYPWGGLVSGAMVMTGAVVARQGVVLAQNRRLLATDPLTGVASRVHVRDELERAVWIGRNGGQAAGVLLIDLDGFKQINDTLGHDAGDALLVGFAERLLGVVSRGDMAGRLGGDEFAVVLAQVGSIENAARVAERVLSATSLPLRIADRTVPVRVSIGVAVCEEDENAGAMLDRADQAMYAAKRRSGDTFEVHPGTHPGIRRGTRSAEPPPTGGRSSEGPWIGQSRDSLIDHLMT